MEGPLSQPGTSSWIPPKSWASPMVTTMTMSRGAVEEAPADDEVHEEAERRTDEQRDDDADEPVHVLGQVELHRDRRRQRAHGAVGEVDDPRRPVVSTRPRASSPLTAPNSAPLRIWPRGAACGQMAGTAKRRTRTAPQTVRDPRRVGRAGVAAHVLVTDNDSMIAMECAALALPAYRRRLTARSGRSEGSGNAPPAYDPILVRVVEST